MNEMQELKNVVEALRAIRYEEHDDGNYVVYMPGKGDTHFKTLDESIKAFFDAMDSYKFHDLADDWDAAEFEANKALSLKL